MRASGTASSAYLGTTGNTMIGRWEIGGGQYYHGTIDEVRVWHRPLSEDEMTFPLPPLTPLQHGGEGFTLSLVETLSPIEKDSPFPRGEWG